MIVCNECGLSSNKYVGKVCQDCIRQGKKRVCSAEGCNEFRGQKYKRYCANHQVEFDTIRKEKALRYRREYDKAKRSGAKGTENKITGGLTS
jgi:hypothetical protein